MLEIQNSLPDENRSENLPRIAFQNIPKFWQFLAPNAVFLSINQILRSNLKELVMAPRIVLAMRQNRTGRFRDFWGTESASLHAG